MLRNPVFALGAARRAHAANLGASSATSAA